MRAGLPFVARERGWCWGYRGHPLLPEELRSHLASKCRHISVETRGGTRSVSLPLALLTLPISGPLQFPAEARRLATDVLASLLGGPAERAVSAEPILDAPVENPDDARHIPYLHSTIARVRSAGFRLPELAQVMAEMTIGDFAALLDGDLYAVLDLCMTTRGWTRPTHYGFAIQPPKVPGEIAGFGPFLVEELARERGVRCPGDRQVRALVARMGGEAAHPSPSTGPPWQQGTALPRGSHASVSASCSSGTSPSTRSAGRGPHPASCSMRSSS